jgi:hypothetical protein
MGFLPYFVLQKIYFVRSLVQRAYSGAASERDPAVSKDVFRVVLLKSLFLVIVITEGPYKT